MQFVMTQLQTINKKLWNNFNKIQLSKKMHEFLFYIKQRDA
jgi:hypothetical protein